MAQAIACFVQSSRPPLLACYARGFAQARTGLSFADPIHGPITEPFLIGAVLVAVALQRAPEFQAAIHGVCWMGQTQKVHVLGACFGAVVIRGAFVAELSWGICREERKTASDQRYRQGNDENEEKSQDGSSLGDA